MNEKILTNKKDGMAVLLGSLATMILSIVLLIVGIQFGAWVGILSIILLSASIIILAGLKILKPQEALVLTLFGKYYGTLKGEGFYFVNPFCSAVNPAARTVLNQSGDVKASAAMDNGMKMSLKIMTLNNNKQKINALHRAQKPEQRLRREGIWTRISNKEGEAWCAPYRRCTSRREANI